MTKKSRRQGRRAPTVEKPMTERVASNAPKKPFEQSFNPDYSYVAKDLKRIGTLAGTFFIVLIVLSFFLRY